METVAKIKTEVNLVTQASERINAQHNALLDQLKGLEHQGRRTEALARFLQNHLPKKVLNRSKIQFEGWENYIYAVIHPKYNDYFTEHDTLLITEFCANQDKWKFDKVLNESSGTFKHELSRRVRYSATYGVEFRTIENIDGCEMIEEQETTTRTVYKVKC